MSKHSLKHWKKYPISKIIFCKIKLKYADIFNIQIQNLHGNQFLKQNTFHSWLRWNAEVFFFSSFSRKRIVVLPIFINIVTIVSMPSDIFSYLDDRLKIDQCHLQETCLWPWRGTKKSKKINLINKSSLLIRNNRLLDNKQRFSHPQFFYSGYNPPPLFFFSYYPPTHPPLPFLFCDDV